MPRPVMVIEPIMIPAAAQAEATSTAPMVPPANPFEDLTPEGFQRLPAQQGHDEGRRPHDGRHDFPMVEEEASTPAAKWLGYPLRFINGMVKEPVDGSRELLDRQKYGVFVIRQNVFQKPLLRRRQALGLRIQQTVINHYVFFEGGRSL